MLFWDDKNYKHIELSFEDRKAKGKGMKETSGKTMVNWRNCKDGKTPQFNQQYVVYINVTTYSCKLAGGGTKKAITYKGFAASSFSL